MIEYENLAKLNKPFSDEFRTAFNEFLERGRFVLDEQTSMFEREFANYVGSRYCVGLSSGLDALVLALKVFDFPNGKEVLVPSNTYIATILAILHNGLKPILVEPNLETYNIGPVEIENKISKNTVAILPVHLYGKLCPMTQIVELAKKNGLRVIEDCAQAHGASFRHKRAGSFGDVNAFSFYPTKNLGALGDGGAITTDDPMLYEKICLYRNYGSRKKNCHELIGFNHRLDEVQSAFLRIKLKYLDRINQHKKNLAKLYLKYLSDKFVLPIEIPEYVDVWHILPIRHKKRDELQNYLSKRGIGTMIHYPTPPHKQGALESWFAGECYPVSDEIHSSILSLPCSTIHSEAEVMRVIEELNQWSD